MRFVLMPTTLLGLVGYKYSVSAFTTCISRTSSKALISPFIIGHHQKNIRSNSNESRHLDGLSRLFASVDEEVDPGQVEGTDLTVLKYPHPSLRNENVEITEEELKDGSISKIAKEMFLVMYASEGVGLAAPQVGINKRLMVYNESGDRKKWLNEMVMVNPKIVEFSEAKDVENEGCLSFPDMRGDVERSKWIKVREKKLNQKR